jgi:hypothetical protein
VVLGRGGTELFSEETSFDNPMLVEDGLAGLLS